MQLVSYWELLSQPIFLIHVQYSDIMRFTLLHNRHHKVSQKVSFFMHCKTVTILLRIRVRGHFVISITRNHESHYVAVLDNPRYVTLHLAFHSLKTFSQVFVLLEVSWF